MGSTLSVLVHEGMHAGMSSGPQAASRPVHRSWGMVESLCMQLLHLPGRCSKMEQQGMGNHKTQVQDVATLLGGQTCDRRA